MDPLNLWIDWSEPDLYVEADRAVYVRIGSDRWQLSPCMRVMEFNLPASLIPDETQARHAKRQ